MSAPTNSQGSSPVAAMLEEVRVASGDRLLGLHTDLARSPSALAAYLGLRHAAADYGTLDPAAGAAIMLTVGAVDGGDYTQAVASQLGIRAGMSEQQIMAARSGQVDNVRTAALLTVMQEAAANTGTVSKPAWDTAAAAGWSDQQLYEAFVHLALTVFCDYFTRASTTEPAPVSTQSPRDDRRRRLRRRGRRPGVGAQPAHQSTGACRSRHRFLRCHRSRITSSGAESCVGADHRRRTRFCRIPGQDPPDTTRLRVAAGVIPQRGP
jgi:alkylhydroperoxidase family enzyme